MPIPPCSHIYLSWTLGQGKPHTSTEWAWAVLFWQVRQWGFSTSCARATEKVIANITHSARRYGWHMNGLFQSRLLISNRSSSTLPPISAYTILPHFLQRVRERWSVDFFPHPGILFSVIEFLKHPFPTLPPPRRGWVSMLAPWNHRSLNLWAVTSKFHYT